MYFQLFAQKFLRNMLLNKAIHTISINHKPFINNDISNGIMTRTKLKNLSLQHRSDKNQKLFPKRRDKCISDKCKNLKNYFAKLNEKNIMDIKTFWKIVKPFL